MIGPKAKNPIKRSLSAKKVPLVSISAPVMMEENSLKKFAWLYIIAGAIAFYYSFLITVEKIALLSNPDNILPCDVSIIVSCGTVMQSSQASLFGFPNPLIGITGFSVILAIGFSMISGFRPKKWFWTACSAGLLLATIFVYWLFYQAVFNIGALCPYCIIVWACTLPLFVFTINRTLKEWSLHPPKWLIWIVLIAMYSIIAGGILWRFRDYLRVFF